MGRTGMCKVGRHIVTFEQVLMTNVKYEPWGEAEEGSLMFPICMVMCSWSYRKDHKYIDIHIIHQFAGLSPGLVIEKSHIGAVVTDCNRQ